MISTSERSVLENMRIGIIGLGYVGLTLAIAAADHGVDVYGTEINEHIKECLSKDKAHFFEPGLDSIIKRVNKKTFHCVDTFSKDNKYDAFIITVGTPLVKGEKHPNFEYIKSALKSICDVYTGEELIILRSTVSVGTTRNIVLPYLSELTKKSQEELLVAMCPERTIEGKAIEELTHLPQIISGNNSKSLEIAQRFFRKMTPYVIPVNSLEEAELVKLYCNTYRDISFAIGNVFCKVAQNFGVDGINIIKHANQGYSRSSICMPGFVAGPCLEKDAYILINNMKDCPGKDFILASRKFNESLEDMVVEWVEKRVTDGKKKKVIAISGMAFKGIPETSDLRGSSSVYIAEKLLKMGYSLNLHDFVANRNEVEALNLGKYFDNLYDACEGTEVLLILNNHRKYSTIETKKVLKKFNNNFAILDIWDVCTNLKYDENVDISTLGNMFI